MSQTMPTVLFAMTLTSVLREVCQHRSKHEICSCMYSDMNAVDTCRWTSLPLEVFDLIVRQCKESVPACRLVCRQWCTWVDSSKLQLSPTDWNLPLALWARLANVTHVNLSIRLRTPVPGHAPEELAAGLGQLPHLRTLCVPLQLVVDPYQQAAICDPDDVWHSLDCISCLSALTGLTSLTLTAHQQPAQPVYLSDAMSGLKLQQLTGWNCSIVWDFQMPILTMLDLNGLDCNGQLLFLAGHLVECSLSLEGWQPDPRPFSGRLDLGPLAEALTLFPCLKSLKLCEPAWDDWKPAIADCPHMTPDLAVSLSPVTHLKLHTTSHGGLASALVKSLDWLPMLTSCSTLT